MGREGFRGFLLAFAVTFVLLAGAMVATVAAVQPSLSDEQPVKSTAEPVYRPTAEDSLTMVVLGMSDGEPAQILLIRFNPQYGQIPLALLPPETRSPAGISLAEHYQHGAGRELKEALETTLTIQVDRYAVLDREIFLQLAAQVGTVEFTLPQPIQYERDGFLVDLPEGRRRLDGRDFADLFAYPGFSDPRERDDLLGELLASAINQHLDLAAEGTAEAFFRLAVNLMDTDVNAQDFELRRQAADFISHLSVPVAGALPVSGEWDAYGTLFSPDADTIQLLRQYFHPLLQTSFSQEVPPET